VELADLAGGNEVTAATAVDAEEKVVSYVEDQIRDGKLRAGTRLPSERVLASRLSITGASTTPSATVTSSARAERWSAISSRAGGRRSPTVDAYLTQAIEVDRQVRRR
jgi:DNA-binding transcriptional MocR family regulator